jgi:VanZ family protein
MRRLRPSIRRVWLWGPAVLQMAAIFAASSISDVQELPGGTPGWLWHGAGYALLGALLLRALADGRRAGITAATAMAAVLCAALYGASDEWHQSFVPGRSPALDDLAADTFGAALAVGIAWAWAAVGLSRHPSF